MGGEGPRGGESRPGAGAEKCVYLFRCPRVRGLERSRLGPRGPSLEVSLSLGRRAAVSGSGLLEKPQRGWPLGWGRS